MLCSSSSTSLLMVPSVRPAFDASSLSLAFVAVSIVRLPRGVSYRD